MNEIDEYNYCLSQIDMLKEKLRNMGFIKLCQEKSTVFSS